MTTKVKILLIYGVAAALIAAFFAIVPRLVRVPEPARGSAPATGTTR